jgi:glycosyltransferase involved in cell wall biosynthesis
MQPMGGTEILRANLEKRINPDDYGINLMTYFNHPDNLIAGKKNVLWNHQNLDQPAIVGLTDPRGASELDGVIFVSNWQMENYRRVVDLPLAKCHVIKNAIEPIEWVEKPREKIKLIYTSTPWRGLDPLLHIFEELDRDDVELHIYSSTKIYGERFDLDNKLLFTDLFQKAKGMKDVVYHGYASNDEVRSALQQSHILAYPCTFEETSCLAVIEAASAGCQIVSTNIGALPETSCGWADMSPMQSDLKEFTRRYISILDNAIDQYWKKYDEGVYLDQAAFFNNHYSWDNRIDTWRNVFTEIKDLPKKF